MATINEMRFLYGGQSSDEFGVFLCDIGTPSTDSNDEQSNLITSTNSFKDTWDFHFKDKSEPLQFTITIAKIDGTYFDANEERIIKKWLCKSKREWLQIDQEDLSDVYYWAILINPRKVDVGRRNAGLQFQVICDCGHAWSGLRTKPYISSSSLNFSLNMSLDYDDYIIYPQLTIVPTVNGTIKIKNNTTTEEIVINNCVTTETIKLDCLTDKIQTSDSRTIVSDWNKLTIGIKDGLNSFSLTGSFNLSMQYRLPVRVGG